MKSLSSICFLILLLSVCSKQCEATFCQDQCPFSRTNIADDSLLIPDSRKGSLTITQSGSATGTLLAGTWKSGFEATSGDPTQFNSWFDDSDEEENVWSVGKTATGNELIGSHSWIRLKRAGESTFQTLLSVGTQGGFVVLGEKIFAGTFQGLYLSTDEGETWTRSPIDCEPYNFTDVPGVPGDGSNGPPKPPDGAKYCDAPVTHMHVLDNGSLIAFYMGYGGAHLIQTQNGDDPLLPESWEALPSFQDSTTCQSGFCHTYDAAVLGDYIYVAFQSLSMVRLNLIERQTWEPVTVGVDSISGDNLTPTGIATRNNAILFAATSNGLYQSNNGEIWQRVSDDACSGRNKPPLMSRGMVDFMDASSNNVLVFGTIHGPWVYREPSTRKESWFHFFWK